MATSTTFNGHVRAYLITIFGVKQNPSQLNDLGRVFGYVNAVFVACRGDVDDNVAVQLRNGGWNGGHVRGARGIGRRKETKKKKFTNAPAQNNKKKARDR